MRIVHVLRSPVGGLFRHVNDLACAQKILGHDVGVVCSKESSSSIEQHLQDLKPHLNLGLECIDMHRLPHPSDLRAIAKFRRFVKSSDAEIVHGHGAKGGILARFSGRKNVYTPHGGSLHYDWNKPSGAAFLAAEKALRSGRSGLVFVCAFERDAFGRKIGLGLVPNRVVHNGLWPEDFELITPEADASDILFIGEMRKLKGVDLLLEALAILAPKGLLASATFVGDGPELVEFQSLAEELGLEKRVRFAGRLPFKEALKLGKLLVLPSRAESFPYVALEAMAAGRTLIASDVGGIGEVVPTDRLVRANDASQLAAGLHAALAHAETFEIGTQQARERLSDTHSVRRMAEKVSGFYQCILAK